MHQPGTAIIQLLQWLCSCQVWSKKAIPWFRGHLQHDWQLLPKAFRQAGNGRASWDVVHQYEVNHSTQFLLYGKARHAVCPANDDKAGWLALMQHYGLATRLLDWTQSILVAAFFAVNDKDCDDQDGAIGALNPAVINESEGKRKHALPLDDE